MSIHAVPQSKLRRRYRLFGIFLIAISLSFLLSAIQPAKQANAAIYNYAFATFLGDAASQEKLSTYTSADGTNFSLLSNTGYTGPSGVLRDPSIMKHVDGKFYVTYTTQSWTTASTNFGIAYSSDLINWTFLTSVTSTIANTHFVWAPEWFKDSDGSINILVAIDDSGNGSNFRIFKYTATNSSLTSWSGPTQVIGAGNYIDPFIVKIGGTYHLFAKGPTYIETATATSLTGPWTWIGTGNWAGWGSGKEGPAAFQLSNGNWRMILDYDLGSHQFVYSDSADGLKTWTAPQQFAGMSGVVRHGTALSIYEKIVNKNSGMVLGVQNGSTTAGGQVLQWSDNGTPDHLWQIMDAGGGYVKIVNKNSGLVLGVLNASTTAGALVLQWSDNGAADHLWQIVDAGGGYYKIVNKNSGLVLGVQGASTTAGALVLQWSDNGTADHLWSIHN